MVIAASGTVMVMVSSVIVITAAGQLNVIPSGVYSRVMVTLTAGGMHSTVNPPAPGVSFRTMVIHWVLKTFSSGGASSGTSPGAQKQPLQIGRLGSPSSNSIQTFAPIGRMV